MSTLTNIPQPDPPSPEPKTGIGLYTKLIISAAVAAGATLYTAQSDGLIEWGEWIAIVITFLTNALVIWGTPMTPAWLATYGKAIFNGLISGLGSIGTGLADGQGLQSPEITAAIIAFFVGTGLVYTAPNALSSDPVDLQTKKLVPISEEVKGELALTGVTTTVTRNGVVELSDAPSPGNLGRDDRDVF